MAEKVFLEVKVPDAILGNVVASNVSVEEYMQTYAENFCEYVEGLVIQMSPVTSKHDHLTYYLRQLFETYLEIRPIGQVRSAPFVMRLPKFPKRRREPDVFVVLNSNPHELTETYMDGPADICIEVVSDDSTKRDYGEKFMEYEKGGVKEYWLLDPLREESIFRRLGEDGLYHPQSLDELGYYRTPLLPGFALHVPTLWQEKLPGPSATVEAIQEMLKNS
jgi:Uma2 family endonuclease